MSYRRRCYRSLDKPITIWGLEPEELFVLVLGAGAVMLLVDPVPGAILGLVLAFGLRRIKRGKPPGYLFELVYRTGALRLLPSLFRAPRIVAPPLPWNPRTIRLSAFLGPEEGERAELRFYRDGKSEL